MVDLPETLTGRTTFLLRQATARAESAGEAALAEEGISGREYGILELLAHRHPRTQTELAQALHIDRTTCAERVAALEARGLVRRVPDPTNRRANHVTITGPGQAQRARASTVLAACDDRFQAALTDQQRSDLRRLLKTLLD